MKCPRCITGTLFRDLYNEIVCLNCARPEPGEFSDNRKRCMSCLGVMSPESRYNTCAACRPQSRNLKQRTRA